MMADANRLISRATSQTPGAPSPAQGSPTPVHTLRAWLGSLENLGYDVPRLVADVGLDRVDLTDPDGLIPCETVGAFLGRTQAMRPLKNMWTRLAAETKIGTFQMLDYLILSCDDVGSAFKQLARYSRLVGAAFTVDVRDAEDPIRVVFVMEPSLPPASAEYCVTLPVLFLRDETGSAVTFAYVSFVHQPDDVAEVEQILGCPVRAASSWAGLALPPSAWRVPLKRRDPILRGMLERHANARPQPAGGGVVVDVRRAITARLAYGEPDISVVARDLAMSSRTLQRRLAATGQSYQEVLETVRREIAEQGILDSTLAIGEVAYLAGYSEPAAFHHAFKRWTGVTPQAFREQRRSAAKPV